MTKTLKYKIEWQIEEQKSFHCLRGPDGIVEGEILGDTLILETEWGEDTLLLTTGGAWEVDILELAIVRKNKIRKLFHIDIHQSFDKAPKLLSIESDCVRFEYFIDQNSRPIVWNFSRFMGIWSTLRTESGVKTKLWILFRRFLALWAL